MPAELCGLIVTGLVVAVRYVTIGFLIGAGYLVTLFLLAKVFTEG